MLSESILLIQPWLNYRGAETVSIQLCTELRKRGVPAKILCLYVSDAVANNLDGEMVLLPPLFFQRLLQRRIVFFFFGFWVLLLLGLWHGRNFTLINAHNFPAVWVAVLCKYIFGSRVVWTVHNFPQHPFRGMWGSLYEVLVYPVDYICARQVDVIVPVSYKVAELVYSRYKCQSQVVYPGIDIDFWTQKSSASQFPQFNGKRLLVHVGQIRPEKKQKFTLSVFEKISLSCPDLFLVFAGEQIGGDLKLEIDPALSTRVVVTGRKTKEQLRELYSHTEMLIMPSSWGEGCTLVPLEGIASGVDHVLVTKNCGVDEILDRNSIGTVFPEDAEDFLADKIMQLYSHARKEDYSVLTQWLGGDRFTEEYLVIFNSLR